jgi:hypothetical protein
MRVLLIRLLSQQQFAIVFWRLDISRNLPSNRHTKSYMRVLLIIMLCHNNNLQFFFGDSTSHAFTFESTHYKLHESSSHTIVVAATICNCFLESRHLTQLTFESTHYKLHESSSHNNVVTTTICKFFFLETQHLMHFTFESTHYKLHESSSHTTVVAATICNCFLESRHLTQLTFESTHYKLHETSSRTTRSLR